MRQRNPNKPKFKVGQLVSYRGRGALRIYHCREHFTSHREWVYYLEELPAHTTGLAACEDQLKLLTPEEAFLRTL